MNDLASVVSVSERYSLEQVLGSAGSIQRVRAVDVLLQRDVLLHMLDAEHAADPSALGAFMERARRLARLQHPGIPPVHDLGTLPDGRPFLATQEGSGRSFEQAVLDYHRGEGTALRLVDAVRTAARAVAHGHQRGVVHGSLDPCRLRLGDDGSVVVVDWGLSALAASVAYRPPEALVAGSPPAGGIEADVYALGALLYLLLTGAPPYEGAEGEVAEAVRAGPPVDPGERVGHVPRPSTLLEVCRRAMERRPEARFSGARSFAEALGTWIERRAQRERAQARIREARALLPKLEALQSWAAERAALAASVLEGAPVVASLADKAPGWALQEEAAALERESRVVQATLEQRLVAAVAADPALAEAHEMLAAIWRDRHLEAEADGREADQIVAEAHLRAHAQALPSLSKSRGALLQYLEGHGAITLRTEPAGAQVWMERVHVSQRRLVAQAPRRLGQTPLEQVPVQMGSYRLRVEAPGREPVVLSVHIPRGHHEQAIPPGATEPRVVQMPGGGSLGTGEVLVPAGWFTAGGDPEAHNPCPRQRVWVDGFVMQRFAVTHAEFLSFLDAVRCEHGLTAALAHAPLDPGPTGEERHRLVVQAPDGALRLGTTIEGDQVCADWPVTFVTWRAAMAYAAWLSALTGQSWRLPWELEWEKAARGSDGRIYPWGNHYDPVFAEGLAGRDPVLPAPVDSAPTDVSPYGIRGLGGNAQDWCLDPFEGAARPAGSWPPVNVSEAVYVVRGGGFAVDASWARSASRGRRRAVGRGRCLGFRLVRDYPGVVRSGASR